MPSGKIFLNDAAWKKDFLDDLETTIIRNCFA